MPPLSRPALRWSVLIGLWALVGAVLWILVVQAFLLALNPFCHLQSRGPPTSGPAWTGIPTARSPTSSP